LYCDALKREFSTVKKLGGKIITKWVDIIPDIKNRKVKKKCNFDVEMSVIALDRINDYEELVLCSGDGDFEYLINYLKNKKKRITIISHADLLSHRLKKATRYIVTLGSIRPIIIK